MTDGLKSKIASGKPESDSKDVQIASLESQIEAEKDLRREERFFWVLGSILIVDCFVVFPEMSNWGSSISVTILQIIFLAVFARFCGIDDISVLIDKAFASYGNNKSDQP